MDGLLPSATSLNSSIIFLSTLKTSLQVLQYIPRLSCSGSQSHQMLSTLWWNIHQGVCAKPSQCCTRYVLVLYVIVFSLSFNPLLIRHPFGFFIQNIILLNHSIDEGISWILILLFVIFWSLLFPLIPIFPLLCRNGPILSKVGQKSPYTFAFPSNSLLSQSFTWAIDSSSALT